MGNGEAMTQQNEKEDEICTNMWNVFVMDWNSQSLVTQTLTRSSLTHSLRI